MEGMQLLKPELMDIRVQACYHSKNGNLKNQLSSIGLGDCSSFVHCVPNSTL